MAALPLNSMKGDDKVDDLEVPAQIESVAEMQHFDPEEEKQVLKKTDYILLPVLCLLLNVAYLDRTNIGNARILGMTEDLDLTGSDYNIALFMFFIPYLLLDVPANMVMRKFRPSVFLSILMFSWGEFKVLYPLFTGGSSWKKY